MVKPHFCAVNDSGAIFPELPPALARCSGTMLGGESAEHFAFYQCVYSGNQCTTLLGTSLGSQFAAAGAQENTTGWCVLRCRDQDAIEIPQGQVLYGQLLFKVRQDINCSREEVAEELLRDGPEAGMPLAATASALTAHLRVAWKCL